MNLGSLYAGVLGTTSVLSDLILVSPDKQLGIIPSYQSKDQRGFLFHIVGEESVSISSDITDHYIEDNTALQDHIALRPETITISGFIGELNNVTPDLLLPVKAVVDRLAMLGGYVPGLTSSALRAYNTAEQLYRIADKAKQALAKLSGFDSGTKQQKAFNEFYYHYLNRQLFYVQTPYAMFSNMAIQSMRFTQNEGDKNSSDIEITFKKIRLAQVLVTEKETSDKIKGSQVNKGSISL